MSVQQTSGLDYRRSPQNPQPPAPRPTTSPQASPSPSPGQSGQAGIESEAQRARSEMRNFGGAAPKGPPGSPQTGAAGHLTTMPGDENIPSYTGGLPSPFPLIPNMRDDGDTWPVATVTPSELRGWVQDASEYHGVPPAMLAVILQQENNPNASGMDKFLQAGERALTTGLSWLDDVVGDIIPDQFSRGSTGLANMSDGTLQETLAYHQQNFPGTPVVPGAVADRLWGMNADTGISGVDTEVDMYYAAAHLRQLIDEVTGEPGFSGELTPEQTQAVFTAYNGSGPMAEQYGEDAMALLNGANSGKETLYFYET